MEKETKLKKLKLSNRELEVLSCLKEGLKSRDIARVLFINEKTISTYILRLKRKLSLTNSDNVYKLVSVAISKGMIEE